MTRHGIDLPQFYLTAPSACPYLPDRVERKIFTHLVGERALHLNDVLSSGGFRRSQTIAYKPSCEGCSACVSVRVRVDDFKMRKSFKRITNLNRDLLGSEMAPIANSEHYHLFCDYLHSRHPGGGMTDMSSLDFAMMIEDSHVSTRLIEYRMRGPDSALTGRGEGPLIASALTDVLSDGLSMVYSFFDTSYDYRSLGTFMILDHIARARKLGLPYVYLGYWVKGSQKMDYKMRFSPLEMMKGDGWIDFQSDATSSPKL